MDRSKPDSGYRFGTLPESAPLALGYVPMQKSATPAYESSEALERGTLFPGLDLPFMNIVNNKLERSPMTELMAIDFVVDELELYLDTHCSDREAFSMYQSFLMLKEEAHRRYVKECGPLKQTDMLGAEKYSWLDNPWPWDYMKEG